MKLWIAILALALLLTGCTAQDPTVSTTPTITTPTTQPTIPTTLPEPVPDVLSQWYVELDREYNVMAPMGEDLLLFGEGVLTRICPDDGSVIATAIISVPLPGSGMLQALADSVAYYDAADNSLVTLDASLQEISRTTLTEAPTGDPYLAPDGKTVYYCTSSGIRIWDNETGISRNLKVQEGDWQGITGALQDGAWLRCHLKNEDGTLRTLLISTENGETVAEGDILNCLAVSNDFYCCLTDSEWIFGYPEQRPQNLLVDNAIAFPQLLAAVTATAGENGLQLDYYDLTTGLRTASEYIPEAAEASCMTNFQDNLIFLSGDRLYTWCYSISPELNPIEDETVYTANRYTYDDPDTEGLASCQSRAEELEQLYGIDILLWQDVTAVMPEGYTFGIEYRTHIYEQGLDTLESTLAQFPEGFLKNVARWTQDGTLHIVLAADVTAPDNTCPAVSGTQYLLGTNAYIALELGEDLQQSFYHTLAHVIDTCVLNYSNKYDQWNKLNPSKFSYDTSYDQPDHSGSKYLEGSSRYFISAFSMSYPVEDRATILEYAMMPDNEACFESKYMQAKLKRICSALKDALDLKDDSYLWAQYLD